MPDCAQCGRPLGRQLLRCHECGACASCCECEKPDTEGFDPDLAKFDRDELGEDPETD